MEREVTSAIDIIAPASIEVHPNYIKLEEKLAKTYFVFSYPRYLTTGWLSPIINMDIPLDISFFFHPIETGSILKQLRKSVTEFRRKLWKEKKRG